MASVVSDEDWDLALDQELEATFLAISDGHEALTIPPQCKDSSEPLMAPIVPEAGSGAGASESGRLTFLFPGWGIDISKDVGKAVPLVTRFLSGGQARGPEAGPTEKAPRRSFWEGAGPGEGTPCLVLPEEVLLEVVTKLDLQDVCSFRRLQYKGQAQGARVGRQFQVLRKGHEYLRAALDAWWEDGLTACSWSVLYEALAVAFADRADRSLHELLLLLGPGTGLGTSTGTGASSGANSSTNGGANGGLTGSSGCKGASGGGTGGGASAAAAAAPWNRAAVELGAARDGGGDNNAGGLASGCTGTAAAAECHLAASSAAARAAHFFQEAEEPDVCEELCYGFLLEERRVGQTAGGSGGRQSRSSGGDRGGQQTAGSSGGASSSSGGRGGGGDGGVSNGGGRGSVWRMEEGLGEGEDRDVLGRVGYGFSREEEQRGVDMWRQVCLLWRRYKRWLVLIAAHCGRLNFEVMLERSRSQVVLAYDSRRCLQAGLGALSRAEAGGDASEVDMRLQYKGQAQGARVGRQFQVLRKGHEYLRAALDAWWEDGLTACSWSVLYEALAVAFADRADRSLHELLLLLGPGTGLGTSTGTGASSGANSSTNGGANGGLTGSSGCKGASGGGTGGGASAAAAAAPWNRAAVELGAARDGGGDNNAGGLASGCTGTAAAAECHLAASSAAARAAHFFQEAEEPDVCEELCYGFLLEERRVGQTAGGSGGRQSRSSGGDRGGQQTAGSSGGASSSSGGRGGGGDGGVSNGGGRGSVWRMEEGLGEGEDRDVLGRVGYGFSREEEQRGVDMWRQVCLLWRRYKRWLVLIAAHCGRLNFEVMLERSRSQVVLAYDSRRCLQAGLGALSRAEAGGDASEELDVSDDATLPRGSFTQAKLRRCFRALLKSGGGSSGGGGGRSGRAGGGRGCGGGHGSRSSLGADSELFSLPRRPYKPHLQVSSQYRLRPASARRV
eukprot:jgi/Mesen1/9593/ME000657S08871